MAESCRAWKGCVSLVPCKKNEFWTKSPNSNTVAVFIFAGLICFILYMCHLYADIRVGIAIIGLEILTVGSLLSVILIRRRGRPYNFHFEKLPPPIENARIEIHGDPAQLVPFVDIEDEVEFGEPYISEVGDVGGRGVFRFIRIASIAAAINYLGWLGAYWVMGTSTPATTQFHVLLIKVALISIVVSTLLMRIRTRYFRVVPQRLDILHGGLFAKKPCLVAQYDLRKARMCIKTIERVVLLRTRDGERKIRIAGLQDLNAFVRSLVHAALSEREPPPMPDDALLG